MAVSNICSTQGCEDNKHLNGTRCQAHQREYWRRYYHQNRDRLLRNMRKRRRENIDQYRARDRAWMARLRVEVLEHYGSVCECCGESTVEFLAIDHVAGIRPDGVPRSSHGLYCWLRKNDYPPGFRALCHNCNMSYGNYGICPHVYS